MKIIISHDVDHLYRKDHYCDLIYPKLWIRSTIEFIKGIYDKKEWIDRMLTPFSKIRHNIPEVIDFDLKYGVESTFFFGVSKGLGLSYNVDDVKYIIDYVQKRNFDVGVHGIAYNSYEDMKAEFKRMEDLLGRSDFGVRTHYVRYDNSTFEYFNKCGYLFDTSEFDKKTGIFFKNPYKVGDMWEFPLSIMDGYLPLKLNEKKIKTIELIEKAEKSNLRYLTVLFHDYQFCNGYATEREWYKWLVTWLASNKYEFISYRDAIYELEKEL